jgi:hypothetical protein
MSAPVVAHQAEVLRKRLDLRVPHAVIGAERIAQHEDGGAFRTFDHNVDRTSVRVYHRHE